VGQGEVIVGMLLEVRETVKPKQKRKEAELVVSHGEPTAVILDIERYQEMLERLEDAEDLLALEKMRKRPLKFRKLEEFLEEYQPGV
jgi:PHD/YefM family antitoxin component YafN of YafNO toxin-antitoxin module